MWKYQIDTTNLEWTQNTGVSFDRDYFVNYGPLSAEKEFEFVKRIGSPSTMAEVYYTVKNGIHMACKILPINSAESDDQIYNEIVITEELALAHSKYFPWLYAKIFATNVIFYTKDCPFDKSSKSKNFNDSSRWFQYYQYLVKSKPELKPQILEYKKKLIDPESTREKLCPDVESINTFEAMMICTELAESDLLYYLNNNKLDEKEYCRLLKHIFKGIQELHVKHNIVHGDLHLGNILINKKLPIIHDFGKSYKSNFSKHFDRQHDIQYFLGQLLDRDDVPGEVRYKLDPIPDIIDNCDGKFPIIDIVKYWERF